MSKDISHILQQWEFQPDEICVRIVNSDDGRQRIQMRVELGVLQMEMDGRPDGLRPEGFDCWLEYYDRQRQLHEAKSAEEAYVLTEQDCSQLWREGVQFYHRYLSLWHLERYDLCARDTAQNLRLFAFVHAHAPKDRIKFQFDQWRPYVIMMQARARGTPLLNSQQYAEALCYVDEAITQIGEFLEEYGESHRASECVELLNLQHWREEIVAQELRAPLEADAPPEDALSALHRKLDAAVAREEYREAAHLRDEIRRRSSKGIDRP